MKTGHEVTVITTAPNFPKGVVFPGYRNRLWQRETLDGIQVVHDGYRRLPGRAVHRRTWILASGRLSVIDTLDGGFATAVARFHLHPGIEVVGNEHGACGNGWDGWDGWNGWDGEVSPAVPTRRSLDQSSSLGGGGAESTTGHFLLPDGHKVLWQVKGGRVKLVPDQWHPEFGLSVPSRCLEVTVEDVQCRLELSWVDES